VHVHGNLHIRVAGNIVEEERRAAIPELGGRSRRSRQIGFELHRIGDAQKLLFLIEYG
jgi:hypothetical protein